jgi:hypothetical protein
MSLTDAGASSQGRVECPVWAQPSILRSIIAAQMARCLCSAKVLGHTTVKMKGSRRDPALTCSCRYLGRNCGEALNPGRNPRNSYKRTIVSLLSSLSLSAWSDQPNLTANGL